MKESSNFEPSVWRRRRRRGRRKHFCHLAAFWFDIFVMLLYY